MTDPILIARLNALLKSKLTGINQYFLHARMLKHKGELTRADYAYKASIDSMKHADMLVEHILTLGGKPQLQALDELAIGQDEAQMLENDCRYAQSLLVRLEEAVRVCSQTGDEATAQLLGRILEGQREQAEFLQGQMALTPVNPNAAKEQA